MDSIFSDSVLKQLNRGKKRKLNIDKWQQNVRKHRRDTGDSCVFSRKVLKGAMQRPDEVSSTDDEGEKKNIERESTIDHMRAGAGYKSLQQDNEIAKANPNDVVLCTDLHLSFIKDRFLHITTTLSITWEVILLQ
nr:unnamed protein product [Callosobruchus chinensis]